MIQPTLRAVMLIVCAIPIALLPAWIDAALWPLWLAALVTVLSALGLDAALTVPASRMAFEVAAPPTLFVGEEGALRIDVSIPDRGAPRWIEATSDAGDIVRRDDGVRGRCEQGRALLELPLQTLRRGEARIDNVWLRYHGPLGLARRVVRRAVELRIAVVPDIRPVRATAIRFFGSRDAAVGIKVERYIGDGSEFDSLREFVSGIDPRTIDWKATARHRRLLYRDTRAERNHTIVIAIDTGNRMSEEIERLPRLDHAIHAALVLGYVALRSGDRVGLYSFGAQPGLSLPPQGRVTSFARIQHATAELDYSTDETNYTLGISTLSTRLARRSLVIVFTDFVDSVTAELMVENLGRLSRRHVVLFVSLRDTAVGERIKAEPRDVLAIQESVVASELQRDRDRVVRDLELRGIHCLDVEPRRATVGLLNRYLDIKRRELV